MLSIFNFKDKLTNRKKPSQLRKYQKIYKIQIFLENEQLFHPSFT